MSTRRSQEEGPKLAPGDYVFLAFLTMGPMTAYDVKKFMTESVSNFWTAAHSQVYQQAARLTRDGYVRQQRASGPRQKRPLSLTTKGRTAVVEWLRSPARPGQIYSELLVKVFFAAQAGDLRATRAIIQQDRDRTASTLEAYEELMKSLRTEPSMRYPAATLEFGIRTTRSHVRWADDQLAAIDEELEPRTGARRRPRSR
jgi:DNA-binding PadR family transcriptional regulator